MHKKSFLGEEGDYISSENKYNILKKYASSIPEHVKNILLLPPDNTRKPSGAGLITNILYHQLRNKANITIMPAYTDGNSSYREFT